MTGPKGHPIVTRADVEAAQAVIDAWYGKAPAKEAAAAPPDMPYLRGLITQAICDAHARGYDAGVARGRRLVANTVRDALDGEGLL